MTQRGAPQQSTHRNTVPHTAPWSPQRRPESLTNDGLQIDYSTYENPEPARSTERTGCGELAPSRGGPSGLRMEIRCWEHGCEGRKFSSLGNYRRHLREKNGQAKGYPCPDCGRVFTRSTARNYHKNSGTCGQNPRQLMLQMQMGLQLQAESHLLASPPLNVPSAGVFEPYIDPSSLTDLCSTSDAFLWGDTDKTSLYR
ncbi:hypothetical protein N7468_009399 [Penicillium chermesinum]|uniref:C2H2-type domain-containing protein n=1 Tax=Penicillium chermesinum TaxID=63820 RepID=A0A9W9NHR4_9EURO|nr:uncharacterized protein N7468_009399 [Penicillium chermesinum]KAJ5220195.1 hypothetical protein N7468_009399 [Penicillium chermesinum]KAJ6157639.1 hypothetical protein N7470_005231 [Penicillium chermesinum]